MIIDDIQTKQEDSFFARFAFLPPASSSYLSRVASRVVYLFRTHRKNTWVSGIFWVLGVPIEYIPARFMYGYVPDT